MTADFLLPALLCFIPGAVCLAVGIRIWRMTPWEYEQERDRLNPNAALWRRLHPAESDASSPSEASAGNPSTDEPLLPLPESER